MNYLQTFKRYTERFGERPDFFTFDAPQDAWVRFAALMRKALERGKPLTAAECKSAHRPHYDGLTYI